MCQGQRIQYNCCSRKYDGTVQRGKYCIKQCPNNMIEWIPKKYPGKCERCIKLDEDGQLNTRIQNTLAGAKEYLSDKEDWLEYEERQEAQTRMEMTIQRSVREQALVEAQAKAKVLAWGEADEEDARKKARKDADKKAAEDAKKAADKKKADDKKKAEADKKGSSAGGNSKGGGSGVAGPSKSGGRK